MASDLPLTARTLPRNDLKEFDLSPPTTCKGPDGTVAEAFQSPWVPLSLSALEPGRGAGREARTGREGGAASGMVSITRRRLTGVRSS